MKSENVNMGNAKLSLSYLASKLSPKVCLKNLALRSAVKSGDVTGVRKLLEQGADPNYVPWLGSEKTPADLARKKRHLEIIKLLVKHGVSYRDPNLMTYIFFEQPEEKYVEEFIFHIIQNHKEDHEIFRHIFGHMLELERSTALKMLGLFLDNGVPIDDYVFWGHTPLHRSISRQRIDFVSLLLERGANVHKKTSKGASPLYLAASTGNRSIIKLLLDKGARIHDRNNDGKTALHNVCASYGKRKSLENIILTLLEHGASLNTLDYNSETPLMACAQWPKTANIMIKELAKSKFKNQSICDKNLEFLSHNDDLLRYYQRYLDELQKMKSINVYNDLSLYDVLEARGRGGGEKLILLSKSDDFLAAFKRCLSRNLINDYGVDLRRSLEIAQKRRDVLKSQEKKLNSIFKNLLPDLAIQRISYFLVIDSI